MKSLFNKKILVYFLCVFSLFVSLIIGENSTGGAKGDALKVQQYTDAFIDNNFYGFQYIINTAEVHFPFFYLLIANLIKFFGDIYVKIFYVLISSLIPFFFYKSLSKIYKNYINIDYLFYFSLIIFFSPNLRSSAAWITNDNLATLFFILSVYYFVLVNEEKNQQKKLFCVYFCFFYLILSSYIRPYYCVFYLYFLIFLLKKLDFINIFYIFIFKFILSLPAFIYVFYLLKFRNSTDINSSSTFF